MLNRLILTNAVNTTFFSCINIFLNAIVNIKVLLSKMSNLIPRMIKIILVLAAKHNVSLNSQSCCKY